ncbi:MAG: helix-turn-helix transcriptional regulator [Planctomycetes bacterium]|nr:helix-turn-helix transcriptional regulator [Planctomycetota bacterium]
MANVGPRIAEARNRLGLSQIALAERLGVTSGAVSQWESGTSIPETKRLMEIAAALNVTSDWLLSEYDLEFPSARLSVSSLGTSAIPDPPDIARMVIKLRTLPKEERAAMETLIDLFLAKRGGGSSERKSRRA